VLKLRFVQRTRTMGPIVGGVAVQVNVREEAIS